LFTITKSFGVKYTEIIKNTHNIQYGIVFPIGIGAILLTLFALSFGWLPSVLSFSPRVDIPILWIIPLASVVAIAARFSVAKLAHFEPKGLAYLILGTLVVGYSEELLVRGITVSALQHANYSVLLVGIISSTIFGLLHFMNYFNGQDLNKTSIQVVGTILMGLNFYFVFILSGTLWLSIIIHALYDLSIFTMGPDPKTPDGIIGQVISIATLATFILPVIGLIWLR
jgi:membrane protease YdiL (CAAX protease family)